LIRALYKAQDAGLDLMVIPKAAAVDVQPVQPWQRPDVLVLTSRACALPIAALNKLQTQTKNQSQVPNSPQRYQTS